MEEDRKIPHHELGLRSKRLGVLLSALHDGVEDLSVE